MLRSTRGTVERLMNYYVTPTPWLQGNRERLMGIKVQSRIIVLYQIFFPSEKLHDTVRFACKRDSGGVLLLNKSASNKMGIMEETAATVLAIKHPHKKLSLCSKLEVYSKHLIQSPQILWRMCSNHLHKRFQGFWTPVVQTWVDFKIWGGQQKASY